MNFLQKFMGLAIARRKTPELEDLGELLAQGDEFLAGIAVLDDSGQESVLGQQIRRSDDFALGLDLAGAEDRLLALDRGHDVERPGRREGGDVQDGLEVDVDHPVEMGDDVADRPEHPGNGVRIGDLVEVHEVDLVADREDDPVEGVVGDHPNVVRVVATEHLERHHHAFLEHDPGVAGIVPGIVEDRVAILLVLGIVVGDPVDQSAEELLEPAIALQPTLGRDQVDPFGPESDVLDVMHGRIEVNGVHRVLGQRLIQREENELRIVVLRDNSDHGRVLGLDLAENLLESEEGCPHGPKVDDVRGRSGRLADLHLEQNLSRSALWHSREVVLGSPCMLPSLAGPPHLPASFA